MKKFPTKKLNKYFSEWLLANGFDCRAEMGEDFYYINGDDFISYAFVVPEEHDLVFFEICNRICPEIEKCDNFILSFFHELGHHETKDFFSRAEWLEYMDFANSNPNFFDYYTHPIELTATEWACNFIVDNVELVKDFMNGYIKIIEKWVNGKIELY